MWCTLNLPWEIYSRILNHRTLIAFDRLPEIGLLAVSVVPMLSHIMGVGRIKPAGSSSSNVSSPLNSATCLESISISLSVCRSALALGVAEEGSLLRCSFFQKCELIANPRSLRSLRIHRVSSAPVHKAINSAWCVDVAMIGCNQDFHDTRHPKMYTA